MKREQSLQNRRMRSKLYYKRAAVPYLLLLPVVLFVALFMLWPMVNVFIMSLQNYVVIKPADRAFIGLANYIEIFTKDDLFYKGLKNSAKVKNELSKIETYQQLEQILMDYQRSLDLLYGNQQADLT